MSKIFGTDGIRCLVNKEPLSAETCLKISKTVAYLLRKNNNPIALTYENEIHKSCFVKFKEKKINIFNEIVFVAIKNGMHHEKGLAFFINKVSKFAPDNNSHVKNIQSTILSFFGINN